jgi:hypothetical protein
VTVKVKDKDGGEGTATFTITVTKEDARVTYTGVTFVSTASVNTPSATVQLAATIQDITAVLGDLAYDPYAGNITNASVQFVDRDHSNAVLCTATVVLINPADSKTGTASCSFTGTVDNSGSTQYTIGIVVGNYYIRNSSEDDSVVTVSLPGSGFITGGGYLVESASAGQYAATSGTKLNFGFNVKYNKSLTNLQGHVNIIVRRNGRVYQIKSTALNSLTVQLGPSQKPPSKAQFVAKANIQDITDPLNPISVAGNANLQMSLTDNGEPGSTGLTPDTIAITVTDGKSGALLFSSNWTGTKTIEQAITGGNLVVH